nr:d-3-phosphoglycerate dehydrogenase 3, chloroplastic [Quercus suber]
MKKMEEVTFLYTSQPPENGHVSFANSPNNSISQNAVIVSLFEIVTQLDFLPDGFGGGEARQGWAEASQGVCYVDCSYNLSPEELCTKISLCDAIIVRSGMKVSREVFESSAGRLKVVGRAGIGTNNVDLAVATEHGCLVVNAPRANTIAAAEHGIALLAAMARNVAQADALNHWNFYTGISTNFALNPPLTLELDFVFP